MSKLTAFFLFALALTPAISAGTPHSRALRFRDAGLPIRARDMSSLRPRDGKVYQLKDMYKGEDFLNEELWEYYTSSKEHLEPTHGMTNYLAKGAAADKGLAKVDGDVFVLSVDDHTKLNEGDFRDSVRISSKKRYNGGLFIADFDQVPYGCAVWPAWWTVGPNWPSGGEIDVLEGVENADTNQYTLHTTSGCSIDEAPKMTGKILRKNCDVSNGDNSGCGVKDTDTRSYGEGFNRANGGVFVHLWNEEGIKIWHFARAEVPPDITAQKPNPDNWKDTPPAAVYLNTDCKISSHFHDHVLTLNIALCGDWAGSKSVYEGSGCPGTCASAVANPENFKNAKFRVKSIAVYE